jgi:hypothetical protein
MMALVPEPEHVNLPAHLTTVLTAHEAVTEGIATHAQKEVAARDERRRKAEAQRKLAEGQHGGP